MSTLLTPQNLWVLRPLNFILHFLCIRWKQVVKVSPSLSKDMIQAYTPTFLCARITTKLLLYASRIKYDLPLLDHDACFSLWQVKMRELFDQDDYEDVLNAFGNKCQVNQAWKPEGERDPRCAVASHEWCPCWVDLHSKTKRIKIKWDVIINKKKT